MISVALVLASAAVQAPAAPAVSYALRLDAAADILSGAVSIGGIHALPFTASRRS